MADRIPLSQDAYDRIKAEHDHLTTVWRLDIARKIESARELGDLSENGDYHAAKEEQGKTEGLIAHLANLIDNAEIFDWATEGPVRPISIVGIRYEGDTEVERYALCTIEERLGDGIEVMSPGSALGQALIGRKVGETVAYQTPTGATLKVDVVSVG